MLQVVLSKLHSTIPPASPSVHVIVPEVAFDWALGLAVNEGAVGAVVSTVKLKAVEGLDT